MQKILQHTPFQLTVFHAYLHSILNTATYKAFKKWKQKTALENQKALDLLKIVRLMKQHAESYLPYFFI